VRTGKGSFGRVRLAECTSVKSKFGDKVPHYFSIKSLKKSEVLRLKQEVHVKAERDLLLNKVVHPFIVTVYGTYKDERNLFMILEYVPGGEVLAACRRDMTNLENDHTKCVCGRSDGDASRRRLSSVGWFVRPHTGSTRRSW
jgi:serine/threonine protein kinase